MMLHYIQTVPLHLANMLGVWLLLAMALVIVSLNFPHVLSLDF
jgi:hypothetical protein